MKTKERIFPPNNFTTFDGSMTIANILFYIYDGRMFVTNTNTIKKKIFLVFSTHESRHKW